MNEGSALGLLGKAGVARGVITQAETEAGAPVVNCGKIDRRVEMLTNAGVCPFPVLLWFLGATLLSEDLSAPQSLPIVYPQPVADCFILRIDNRRYEIINLYKQPVAQLLGSAPYARVKALFDLQKRALADRTIYAGAITQTQTILSLATAKLERARQTLEALRQQRIAYRTSTTVDLESLLRLDNAIITEAAHVNQLEDLEDRAIAKLDAANKALQPYEEKVQKAQRDYVAALKDYDRTLGEIRVIAIAHGKQL